MKKFITILSALMLTSAALLAQVKDYKVVFDITSGDTAVQKTVLRQASGVVATDPSAKIEIVIYGEALSMILKDKSIVAAAVQELAAKKQQASIRVCQVTMKRHNVDTTMLLPGVETVPDGIYEIITKQREGWGYIKVAK